MSRVAKITLIGSIILSGLTVWGVHFLQEWERDTMYQGVLRDEQRRREKMHQQQAGFETFKKDQNILKEKQNVNGRTKEGLRGDWQATEGQDTIRS